MLLSEESNLKGVPRYLFLPLPVGSILVPRMMKLLCIQAFFFSQKEKFLKVWLEIVRLLTLKFIQYMITSYFQQNYKWESLCYVTRGNLNKQNTRCRDSHNRKRWSKRAHLRFLFLNQIMRTTISYFFLFSWPSDAGVNLIPNYIKYFLGWASSYPSK